MELWRLLRGPESGSDVSGFTDHLRQEYSRPYSFAPRRAGSGGHYRSNLRLLPGAETLWRHCGVCRLPTRRARPTRASALIGSIEPDARVVRQVPEKRGHRSPAIKISANRPLVSG